MEMAPRRIGKRFIGRYLFLHILLGTATLSALTVGLTFWLKSKNIGNNALCVVDLKDELVEGSVEYDACVNAKYYLKYIRAITFKYLTLVQLASHSQLVLYTTLHSTLAFSLGISTAGIWLQLLLYSKLH